VQSYSSSLQLNPALAGAYEHPELSVLYRNKWPSIGRYIYTMFTYNQYMNKLKTGLGAYYLDETEQEGLYKTHSIHLDFSPSFSLDSNWVLKPAFEISYYEKTIDWDKYYFQIPPVFVPINEKTFLDYSAGLLLYQKYFDLGFVLHHITEPAQGFYAYNEPPLAQRVVAHVSANIPLDEKEKYFLSPNIQFVMQSDYQQLKLNVATKLNVLLLGVGFQNKDTYNFTAGYESNRFRISYSYDYTVSKLRNASASSHEFFVSFFILSEKMKSVKPSLNRIAF